MSDLRDRRFQIVPRIEGLDRRWLDFFATRLKMHGVEFPLCGLLTASYPDVGDLCRLARGLQ